MTYYIISWRTKASAMLTLQLHQHHQSSHRSSETEQRPEESEKDESLMQNVKEVPSNLLFSENVLRKRRSSSAAVWVSRFVKSTHVFLAQRGQAVMRLDCRESSSLIVISVASFTLYIFHVQGISDKSPCPLILGLKFTHVNVDRGSPAEQIRQVKFAGTEKVKLNLKKGRKTSFWWSN